MVQLVLFINILTLTKSVLSISSQIYTHATHTNYSIRSLKNTSDFFAPFNSLKKGDPVIIRSSRGVEFGEVVAKVKEIPDTDPIENLGEVLRKSYAG